MWATAGGQAYSFRGEHYQITGSPALPRPAQQPRLPVLVGGDGPRKTPRLAAVYADEYNAGFLSLAGTEAAFGRVGAACAAAGRVGWPMRYSAAQLACCGRTAGQVARRAVAAGRDVAELGDGGLAGSPAEVVDKIGELGARDAVLVYLKLAELHDLDHLELLGTEVLPQV